jgi:quercetin dioxygenase-like cupin family protein
MKRIRAPVPRRSAVVRARGFRWRGIVLERYRELSGAAAAGASRQVLLAGSRGAPIRFDVRYFELAAGRRTNFEQHRHAHVVIGLRGSGRVRLNRRWLRLRAFDMCYVAPDTPHELHNDRRARFGFLCLVDAQRDRGRALRRHPVTASR